MSWSKSHPVGLIWPKGRVRNFLPATANHGELRAFSGEVKGNIRVASAAETADTRRSQREYMTVHRNSPRHTVDEGAKRNASGP
jgi:hypothetical protein